jgi:carbon monoxide dehydrogenase subunit G
MVSFTIRKHFEAPPERVFEVCTDLRSAAKHIGGIRKLEVLGDGPIGVGTRFRETRVMFKRDCTEEMEIVSFDPPKSYAVGCESHGCRYRTDFRVTASGGGSQLEMTFEAEPQTLLAKMMGVLFRGMIKSCMREMEKDLEDLKAVAEGKATAVAASG